MAAKIDQIGPATDIYAVGKILQHYGLASNVVVRRCLKENPKERFQSVKALRKALRQSESKKIASRIGLGLAVALLIGVIFWLLANREKPLPPHPDAPEGAIAGLFTINYNGNQVYFGASSAKPEIGDVRVTFTYVPIDQQISLVANVKGDTFEKYVDPKNGKTVSSVAMGEKTADEMFESMKQGNKMLTWIIRIALMLLIILGFRKIFALVPTLLKVLPFLGKGVGAILGLVCVVLGFVWSLVFIAIAWVAVRPVLGISLLVVAIALIVWLVMRSKKQKAVE